MRRSLLLSMLSVLAAMALLPLMATTAAPRAPAAPRYSVRRAADGAPLARLRVAPERPQAATAADVAARVVAPGRATPVADHVLVVDDDRDGEEYGGHLDVSRYVTEALTQLGQSYRLWDTIQQGPPALADMQGAAAVVWFTGLDFHSSINDIPVLTTAELHVMQSYLRAGGRLLLTGEDALSSSDDGPAGLGSLLHVTYLQDSVFDPTLTGKPAPRPSMTGYATDALASGRTFDLSWEQKRDGAWPDGWGGEFATDEAAPADTTASPILMALNAEPVGAGAVGIKAFSDPTLDASPAYAARTVWLGFGLENINNDTGFASRSDLLGRILAWLGDDISATLSAATAPAGEPSTFSVAALPTEALPRGYRWDFGDGSPYLTTGRATVSHTFSRGGAFTVRVEVHDSLQHSTVVSEVVTIRGPILEESTKTASKATASAEETITYTLTIRNSGDGPAARPQIADAIPGGVAYVAGSAGGGAEYNAASKTIEWRGAQPLPAGGEHSISFQVRVAEQAVAGSSISNTADFRDLASGLTAARSASTLIVPQPVVTLALVADTYLDKWQPSVNYGGYGRVHVRAADVLAPLLLFDTAPIPAGAAIKAADLRLYADMRSNAGTTRVGIFQMVRPWSELGATWQQAAPGAPWSRPGANGLGTDRLAEPASTVLLNSVGNWYTFDIRSLVQAWVSGQTNAGVTMKYVGGDVMVAYTFAASEYPDPSRRPQLTVRYVNP